MIKEMRKNEKGFTLVELVVVIAILAILALLLVPRIIGSVDDAKESREIANARTIASEITTHNAVARSKTPEEATIPTDLTTITTTGYPISESDMSALGREADELPDDSVVVIIVDSDGNATIDIK